MRPAHSSLVHIVGIVAIAGLTALATVGCDDGSSNASPTAASGVSGVARGGSQVSLDAKAERVGVCHVTGTGSYRLITVNGNAVAAHLGHGDGLPGDGQFDGACNPVPVNACPCFSAAQLDAIAWIGEDLQCFAGGQGASVYASLHLDSDHFEITGEEVDSFPNSCYVYSETLDVRVEQGIDAAAVAACFDVLTAKMMSLDCAPEP